IDVASLLSTNTHFFLSLLRRPPTSPLFPYTTLFRSRATRRPRGSRIRRRSHPAAGLLQGAAAADCARARDDGPARVHLRLERIRSEEHTSELQSLRHLVCRLLLEKKKKTYTNLK